MVEQQIDELVELITKRVTERLQELGATSSPNSYQQQQDCRHQEENCTNCGMCVVKKPEAVENIIKYGASRIGSNSGVGAVDSRLASMIDHTLLKPDVTQADLTKLCKEAKEYNFATVCVNSSNIALVARLLKGSTVKPIAVVGFPLGAATSHAKAFEAKEAISAGAQEIDMVINIGALKSKDYHIVYEDIKQVVEATKPYPVKVILETSSLDHDEKVAACVLAKTAGAAFVKTSTGFGSGGATVEDVALMRKVVGDKMHVKASGGIRTREDAEKMIKAGANRIGASASVAIVTGKQNKFGGY